MSEFAFVGTYEVREVPQGWRHPKGKNGKHVPLLPFGHHTDGELATADEMMPPPLGEIEIVAYEAVSEGTPISPGFPDTPEGRLALAGWCANHVLVLGTRRAGVEAWAALLFHDGAITADGIVIAPDR